jgi:hypothetical protein
VAVCLRVKGCEPLRVSSGVSGQTNKEKVEKRANTEGWAGELRVISHAIEGASIGRPWPAENCNLHQFNDWSAN